MKKKEIWISLSSAANLLFVLPLPGSQFSNFKSRDDNAFWANALGFCEEEMYKTFKEQSTVWMFH